ncbi:hypothetical protein SAMN05444166_4178 [Singulisphaera sp. GP187]|uniref:hypothetical protein n=1 Tax=Singulisphaera sp. GP187 TaxID=1882752 RepID=UPI00092A9AA1|nr:hypothetical protein [Singulisphaera sp. GP187]SIO37257.1 hypothetical protein SAMN05444166_4178 [Singulisphaera sp. GP187]
MLSFIGSARNLSGLILDGIAEPVPCVEVVLICSKPFYGIGREDKLSKAAEICDLRFTSSPKGLRELATRLAAYADEAEECFGVEPEDDEVREAPGNLPEQLQPESAETVAGN